MRYGTTTNKEINTFNLKHVTCLPSIPWFPLSSEFFVRQSEQTLLLSKVTVYFVECL